MYHIDNLARERRHISSRQRSPSTLSILQHGQFNLPISVTIATVALLIHLPHTASIVVCRALDSYSTVDIAGLVWPTVESHGEAASTTTDALSLLFQLQI